jgi:methyltransferase (TIGR00027 family)
MDYDESAMNRRRAGSVTAEGMALLRAGESRRPEGERICDDPFAIRFVRPEVLALARGRGPEEAEAAREAYERAFPGHRNSLLTRVRFFDDTVRREVAAGMPQVVIAGAGFDSRAYRLEGLRDARVIEVDRAETQAHKTACLRQCLGSLPPHVTFLPFDLRDGRLLDALAGTGFDPGERALFVMEGLLYYLPPPLVRILLAEIATGAAPGSQVLFDFFPLSIVDGTHPSPVAQAIRRNVASVGEPFLFGLPEGGETAFLRELGFGTIRIVTDRDYLGGLLVPGAPARKTTGLLGFCQAEV